MSRMPATIPLKLLLLLSLLVSLFTFGVCVEATPELVA